MNTHDDPMSPLEREEIVLGRVVDGESTDADWHELEKLSLRDPFVWKRLAEARRDNDALCAAFTREVAPVAERVEAPEPYARASHEMRIRLRSWTGWAAAACLAAAWAGLAGVLPRGGGSTVPAQTAALVELTPEQALQTYLEKGQEQGRVITQLPKEVMEVRRASDDELVVVFTRSIVEMVVVPRDKAVTWNVDELGETVLAPVHPARFRTETEF